MFVVFFNDANNTDIKKLGTFGTLGTAHNCKGFQVFQNLFSLEHFWNILEQIKSSVPICSKNFTTLEHFFSIYLFDF